MGVLPYFLRWMLQVCLATCPTCGDTGFCDALIHALRGFCWGTVA